MPENPLSDKAFHDAVGDLVGTSPELRSKSAAALGGAGDERASCLFFVPCGKEKIKLARQVEKVRRRAV